MFQPLLEEPSYHGGHPASIEERSLPILDVLLGRLARLGAGSVNDGADLAADVAVEGLAKLLIRQELQMISNHEPHAHHLEAAEVDKVRESTSQK